jgi:hypothetical protein
MASVPELFLRKAPAPQHRKPEAFEDSDSMLSTSHSGRHGDRSHLRVTGPALNGWPSAYPQFQGNVTAPRSTPTLPQACYWDESIGEAGGHRGEGGAQHRCLASSIRRDYTHTQRYCAMAVLGNNGPIPHCPSRGNTAIWPRVVDHRNGLLRAARQRNLYAHALIVALLSRTATKGAPRTSRAARGKLNPLINYP